MGPPTDQLDRRTCYYSKLRYSLCVYINQHFFYLDVYAELAFDYHISAATEPVELQRHIEEDKELKHPKKCFVKDLEVIGSNEMSTTSVHYYFISGK